jgi:hypothetical protein
VAVTLLLASAGAATTYVRARAQVVTPRPNELRFQVVLNEPLATPDQRSVVAGTSALLVKDRVTGLCFLAVTIGDAMGLSPTPCQP